MAPIYNPGTDSLRSPSHPLHATLLSPLVAAPVQLNSSQLFHPRLTLNEGDLGLRIFRQMVPPSLQPSTSHSTSGRQTFPWGVFLLE